MSSHPTNPVLGPEHKPTPGQTRGHDGNLEWFDSHTGAWRPAVRQHTIRSRLIGQSRQLGSYTYPRDGSGDDVASFLPKDRDFGTAWAHRPAILFQLYAGPNRVSTKPQGVLMDGDRVMLDPYDYPIRDFPELPVTLSSKEKGMWIEYYMRQNKEIKPYDLMARMGKTANENAVRIYTLNERATKFRNTAACLSWGEKTGSAEKKAYILSLLPPGAADTRSLGRDLDKQQQEQLIAANKGKFPNRRRKTKRTLEAQTPMATPTPGFQPQAPVADGEIQGQSGQLRNETEPLRLEGRGTQLTNRNEPIIFNDFTLGRGSQLGARQDMLEQDLNLPHSAGGANYNGCDETQYTSSPANFLAPRQLDPPQSFLNNGGNWSSLDNLRDHSYSANTSRAVNVIGVFNPALYAATHGGQTAEGESSAVGEARGFRALQAQGDRLVDRPNNKPVQRRKRPRTTLAEDEAESYDNRRNKRARIDAPVEAPQDPFAPAPFGDAAGSLLLFDENGFIIPNNTPGLQGQAEGLYPAAFDKFLQDTQHEENHVEDQSAQNTRDAPATQGSNIGLLDSPASLPTQGQKRRRSSSSEDGEEACEDPKSKRLRTEDDIRTSADSIDSLFKKVDARLTRDENASAEFVGAGESLPTTSQQEEKDEGSNDDEASESSRCPSSADSDDGSEYTPSPYHQTSLKTIARPTTGGKGPYTSSGRPVTGGKGPLKPTNRANVARKTPSKQK